MFMVYVHFSLFCFTSSCCVLILQPSVDLYTELFLGICMDPEYMSKFKSICIKLLSLYITVSINFFKALKDLLVFYFIVYIIGIGIVLWIS